MSNTSLMDVTSVSAFQSSWAVQGASHHHHKPQSLTDMISQMSSAVDDAVKAGKLSDDQAAAIKKDLEAISDLLKNGQASSSGSNGTSNAASQLSSDDRQTIRDTLKDIGKQIFAALSSQSAQAAGPVDDLFSKIDTNGDKSISKNE
jgi:hypothetical protein